MALFKIFNNIDSHGELPATYTKGYLYFDAVKGLFYIDTAGNGTTENGERMALNSWSATNSENDGFIVNPTAPRSERHGQNIAATYIKNISINNDGNMVLTKGNNTTSIVDCSALTVDTAQQLAHTLTFGANGEYVFDGTQDVTVPVYTGAIQQ